MPPALLLMTGRELCRYFFASLYICIYLYSRTIYRSFEVAHTYGLALSVNVVANDLSRGNQPVRFHTYFFSPGRQNFHLYRTQSKPCALAHRPSPTTRQTYTHVYAVRFVNGERKMTENNIYVPPQVKSELSDESEYDAEPEEFDVYKRKYQLLLDRCEVLQQDNERLVYRIQRVRKLLKRTRKEKKFLIDRLDQHGDRWREAPMGVLEENSVFQTTLKPEKGAKSNVQCPKDEKPKKGTKRKGGKADPNAPKRPANPFFQFCQEQRPRVMERLAGEPEPSKQELTRQLATTWKSLTSDDKKVYYDMYERSKEKYVAEMQIYNKKAEDAPPQPALNTT